MAQWDAEQYLRFANERRPQAGVEISIVPAIGGGARFSLRI